MALELEAQIIARMLERIDLKPSLEILTNDEWLRRVTVPHLDTPPEQQEWDISVHCMFDFYGHTGASFLALGFIDDSEMRWIDYDKAYEDMWNDMARTVDRVEQEKKIRQLGEYVHDRAYFIFIYSPLTLYAVNKEVNLVPQRSSYLRLKETSVTENHWSLRGKNN